METKNLLQARTLDIEQIEEGQTYQESITVTDEMLQSFIKLSADCALAHMDEAQAQKMGYEGKLVHGFLVALRFSRMLGMFLPGSNTVIHQFQFDALLPVYVGDTLAYTVKVDRVIPSVETVRLELSVVNQDDQMVGRGKSTCKFRA